MESRKRVLMNLQGSSGDAGIEDKPMDAGEGGQEGGGEVDGESGTDA